MCERLPYVLTASYRQTIERMMGGVNSENGESRLAFVIFFVTSLEESCANSETGKDVGHIQL